MAGNQTLLIGACILTGLVGFAAGRLSAGDGPEPDPRKTKATVTAPKPAQSPQADDSLLELRDCEQQLADCTQSATAAAGGFPSGTMEAADTWTAMVEAAFEQCDIDGLELAVVECSDYPCVAGLRPDAPFADEPDSLARTQARVGVEQAFRACSIVKRVLGKDAPEGAVAAIDMWIPCGRGKNEDAWMLAIMDPKGKAFAAATSDDDSKDDALAAWVERRTQAVQAKWKCR